MIRISRTSCNFCKIRLKRLAVLFEQTCELFESLLAAKKSGKSSFRIQWIDFSSATRIDFFASSFSPITVCRWFAHLLSGETKRQRERGGVGKERECTRVENVSFMSHVLNTMRRHRRKWHRMGSSSRTISNDPNKQFVLEIVADRRTQRIKRRVQSDQSTRDQEQSLVGETALHNYFSKLRSVTRLLYPRFRPSSDSPCIL